MKKIKSLLDNYGRLLSGLGILVCVAGLVIGYVKPKQKIETISINMAAEGEADLEMEPGMVLDYICSTKGYPMAGIQVGVAKYGKALADTALLCSVYDENKEALLSQTLIAVGELDDGQYVYIPFENPERCNGTICVEFTCSGPEGELAGLKVNTKDIEDAATYVNGTESTWMLKSYYIYKVAYYPLLFDLCTLLLMFMGVFFLGGKRKMKQEKEVAADE